VQPRIPRTKKGAITADIRETLKVHGNTLLHVLVQRFLLLGETGWLYEWKAHIQLQF
jgi:hypothetical protein